MRATNKRMTDSSVLMSMATAPALMNCRKRPQKAEVGLFVASRVKYRKTVTKSQRAARLRHKAETPVLSRATATA